MKLGSVVPKQPSPPPPEKAAEKADRNDTPATNPVGDGDFYTASVWGSNDGKFGVSVKAGLTRKPGETIDEWATRINRFTVAKQRELETLLTSAKES